MCVELLVNVLEKCRLPVLLLVVVLLLNRLRPVNSVS